mgnify:CR=1 FL=1
MKKKDLRQNIFLGLMGASILGGSFLFSPAVSYAASAQDSQAVVAQMAGTTQDDPNAFTARIQRILDDYHQDIRARQQARQKLFEHHSQAAEAASAATALDTDSSVALAPEQTPASVTPSASSSLPPIPRANTARLASDGRYNFDWQGTPIAQSIYAVAKRAHKDVVVNGNLDGNVYMSLHNVTCEQAMQRLSAAFNFNWMTDDNAIIVSTSQLMMQSKVFPVHHAFDLEKLSKELQALGIAENNIYANSEQRTVSVTGTPYQLKQVEQRLSSVDRPISQCLVVAQLIELQHGRDNNLGFQYSLPTYSHSAETNSSGDTSSTSLKGPWLDKLTFSGSVTASRNLSKGKVIARPMVMMLNGQEGMVNFGEQVPVMSTTSTSSSTEISVDYKDVGTKLTITPSINEEDGEITLKIDTEVSNITKYITQGQTSAPQISTRQATTSAHLRSGQSFVIGGLMSAKDLDNLSGIPGLMNLPILGELFKYHSHSKSYAEVYIMITPYIVTDDINPKELLRKADTSFEEEGNSDGHKHE